MLSLKSAFKSAVMKAPEIFQRDVSFKKVPPASPSTPCLKFPSQQDRAEGEKEEKRFRPFTDLDKSFQTVCVFFFQGTKPFLAH